tara:strand:- start:17968 stop:18570 length:603 start_codon:yes stop_codon:yes gene_type:complete
MKTKLKSGFVYFMLIMSVLVLSCGKDDEAEKLPCDETNTTFNQLYDDLVNNQGYINQVTMDTEIHEYTFEIYIQKDICQIGYESQHDDPLKNYTIEIEDKTNNIILYTGNHNFSGGGTVYQPINPAITIQQGNIYTIRRIQTDWAPLIHNTIGRLLQEPNSVMVFPYTWGDLTIISSNFYQNGGPAPNFAIPYIDIVFSN